MSCRRLDARLRLDLRHLLEREPIEQVDEVPVVGDDRAPHVRQEAPRVSAEKRGQAARGEVAL